MLLPLLQIPANVGAFLYTLGRFVEEVEVYLIDEAFLSQKGYESVYPVHAAFAV